MTMKRKKGSDEEERNTRMRGGMRKRKKIHNRETEEKHIVWRQKGKREG